jgi:hypothetical protein
MTTNGGTRKNLTVRVRKGLSTLAGFVNASGPEILLGVDAAKTLTREERASVENMKLALQWIDYISERPKKT